MICFREEVICDAEAVSLLLIWSGFLVVAMKVICAARLRRTSGCRFVVNLVKGLSYEGKPRAQAQWRTPPRQARTVFGRFFCRRVAEKADITMPELAAELAAATCDKVEPRPRFHVSGDSGIGTPEGGAGHSINSAGQRDVIGPTG